MIFKTILVGVLLPLLFGVFVKYCHWYILEKKEVIIVFKKRIVHVSFFNAMLISISVSIQYYFGLNQKVLSVLYLLSLGSIALLVIGFFYELFTDRYNLIFNEIDIRKAQIEMYKYSLLGSFLLSLLGVIFVLDRITQ